MINKFNGNYRFLSNFFAVQIPYGDLTYPSVEHAYQAQKCEDPYDRRKFLTITAKEAKALGRKVKTRSDWEEVKVDIMRELLKRKFALHTTLAAKLLATDPRPLQEGNWWHDNFWGRCTCQLCKFKAFHNWLGRLLMERRDCLKEYANVS